MRRLFTFLVLYLLACGAVVAQLHDGDLEQAVDRLLLDARFQEAIDLIAKEAPTSRSLYFENKRAEALTRLGRLEEAGQLLTQIETSLTEQGDDFLEGVTAANAGFLQLNYGRNDLAEASLEKAMAAFGRCGQELAPEAAQALTYLGLVYMNQGKYSQAQEQLHRVLAIRENLPTVSPEWIAATYNDLGLVYSQTDKDQALNYAEKALTMYHQLYGDEHPKIAIASINTGILYRDVEFYGDAVNHFETALRIWTKVTPGPTPAKAIALYNLGQTYVRMGDQKTAMAFYAQAQKMYEDSYGTRHPDVALVLNAVGNLHAAQGDFEAALKSYQKALQANVPDFHSDNLTMNPALKNYYHGTRLLHTLLFKTQAFEGKYRSKTLRFADLREALGILVRCDSLIDQLRQHSTNESDKLLLGAMATEVYADGVRIAFEAGLNALQKDQYFRQAFYFAEKSKGAVLLESIAEADARAFAGIPQELIEEEKALKSGLALAAQKLAERPAPEQERIIRQDAFELKRRYEGLIGRLEEQFPAYFNLKFNSAAPSIEQIQAMLDEQTALLSYFVDDKNSELYVFTIRQNHFGVEQRPWSPSLDRYITGMRNGLYFEDIATYKESAWALGKVLLPKLPASVTRLVIVPQGRLGIIPFETLLTRKPDDTENYQRLPYLLNRFAVRYEFSAGLILQKANKATPSTAPSIFLCAPVRFPANDFPADLPGTEEEVRDISNLFRQKNLGSIVYTGSEATEDKVKSGVLKNHTLLHFATHGIADESRPELSQIFLHPQGGAEDGHLFAGEIYNLEINADLVTLSACQTGLGKLQKGEGVIGLSRALVYAGAQNLVVSLWNVGDASTAILMQTFYQHVLEKSRYDYSASLREAKLGLLKNEQYAAPFYWAPFIVIGF